MNRGWNLIIRYGLFKVSCACFDDSFVAKIGEDIRDRIIPRAVDYFTGKALEYDAEDLSDDEFEDEDDSEDEDESGEEVPAGPRRGGKGRGQLKTEQQEECKQQ